jgi:hypothetical protein
MNRSLVDAAEQHDKFIAPLSAQRARLHEAKVMGVAGDQSGGKRRTNAWYRITIGTRLLGLDRAGAEANQAGTSSAASANEAIAICVACLRPARLP